MAQIVEGNRRGGRVLIYNSFRYHKNRLTKTKIHWRCWRKSCRSALVTNLFDVKNFVQVRIHVYHSEVHNHADDHDMIVEENLREGMKAVVRGDPCRPVKRAFDSALSDLRRQERATQRQPVPEFHTLRSCLSRAKREGVPNVPHDIHSVNIVSPWDETWSEERFLLHNDNHWGIAVFATDENLHILRKCTELYIDGTFRSTPVPYKQFVTIHGKYHGRLLCLASSLVGGKSIGHYRQVFQCLKRAVRRTTHHRLMPSRVVCDFEQSIIISLETEFPRVTVSGCYFHFCQSLYRKVQNLGLAIPYQQDLQLQKAIRMLLAMGYLPVAIVRHSFTQFCASQLMQGLSATYPQLDDFIHYITVTYFTGPFPPAMWNVYTRDSSNRTNNHVEGYHKCWNQRVGVRHPSLWTFIRHMKDAQSDLEVSVDAITTGGRTPRQRQKWRRLEHNIKRLKRQYQRGQRTVYEYWKAVCNCVTRYV